MYGFTSSMLRFYRNDFWSWVGGFRRDFSSLISALCRNDIWGWFSVFSL